MENSKQTVLKVPIVISVIMNKGGVGKTTTCANLASALCETRPTGNHFKIGVMDLDPQTNLSAVLGLEDLYAEHGDELVTIAEFLDGNNSNVSAYDFFYEVKRDYFGGRLHIMPGHIDLESLKDDLEFELKLQSNLSKNQIQQNGFSGSYDIALFERKKSQLFNNYRERLKRDLAGKLDYIIIDTPPSRGFLTQFALALSDYVLPVMIPGTKEFDGLVMMEQLIADCWASYNPKLSVAGVLINNLFEREVLSKDIRAMAAKRYHGREIMLKTEIPRSVRIAESISNDSTIFESNHKDAENYKNIYRKLLSELYSRALTNTVSTTISPQFFYDLNYSEDTKGVVNE